MVQSVPPAFICVIGRAVCLPKDSVKTSWQGQLRAKLERDRPYYETLMSHTNEEIAGFAGDIVEEL